MGDLNELVERLGAAIDLGTQIGARGKNPTNIYNIADEAFTALTSLIAERDEAMAGVGYNATVADFHDALATQWHTRALAAEAQLKAAREVLIDCATIMPRYRLAGKTLVEDEEFSALLERVNETLVLVP